MDTYRGQGRDRLEFSIKTLLTFSENGAILEIARLHRDLVLLFCRQDGQANWAELRLRIPLTNYSFPFGTEVRKSLAHHGYEILATEDSSDCIATVRIPVEDIWAVGSAARAAFAADLALDEMGYGKDAKIQRILALLLARPDRQKSHPRPGRPCQIHPETGIESLQWAGAPG